jgi:hypothetical protein
MKEFLPISQEDINARGWEQIDFLFISGDAYVDHPSFGPAVICRVLEAQGYKVALLCQPDWRKLKNFEVLGKPRLAVLILEVVRISAGFISSGSTPAQAAL